MNAARATKGTGARMPKRCCSGRGDAHFGWCRKVGGNGLRPGSNLERLVEIRKLLAPRRGGVEVRQAPAGKPSMEPGVNILRAVRTPEEERARQRDTQLTWSRYSGEVDWSKIEVEASAHQLQRACARGLPAAIPFGYHPKVLAMYGLDFPMMESVIRAPHRVEIRPESKQKGYPILAFHRGDVAVILGMQFPTKPAVIAVYVSPLLENDTYRPGGTGGGGARKKAGLPTSLQASVRTLRMVGIEIPENWDSTADKAVEASYKGKSLGKITVGVVSKQQVQSDYQRALRRKQAIDQRAG